MLVEKDFYELLQNTPKCLNDEELDYALTNLVKNHSATRTLPEMGVLFMFIIHNSELIRKRKTLVKSCLITTKRNMNLISTKKHYPDWIKDKCYELASCVIYIFEQTSIDT
jgi:selenophosphate synthase